MGLGFRMLARIYPHDYVLKRPLMGLLLGFLFSIVGIGITALFFKRDPAIITVAFTSLLLYPTVTTLLDREKKNLEKERRIEDFFLLGMHRRVLSIYLFIFLGVLLGYAFFSLFLPSLAANTLFESQISVLYGSVGKAVAFTPDLFFSLFSHNFQVLLLAFTTALLVGDGAIFLLVWNASVWGTIFGNLANTAANFGALNPAVLFGIILMIVLPHTIIEATSYIMAAMSGGVTSDFILSSKSKNMEKFILRSLAIFLGAVVVLAVGMFVEQYVLINSDLYRDIIRLSGLI